MAKPTSTPDWTLGNPSFGTVTVEPSAGKKLTGWSPSERPPAEFINWLFFNTDEWIKYLDGEVDLLLAGKLEYDAIVGVGGTHADLATLMADPLAGSTIKNVLITDPQTLTASVTFDEDDMTFTFTPKAVLADGGAGTGIIVDAERVRILRVRMINFTTEAISVLGTAKYTMIHECFFASNTATITDAGIQTSLNANIEEL